MKVPTNTGNLQLYSLYEIKNTDSNSNSPNGAFHNINSYAHRRRNCNQAHTNPVLIGIMPPRSFAYICSIKVKTKYMKKQIKAIEINSKESVEQFVKYVIEELNVNFHCDDSFEDYDMFSKKQAAILDEMNEQCFEYCDANNLDYYLIAGEILNKKLGI